MKKAAVLFIAACLLIILAYTSLADTPPQFVFSDTLLIGFQGRDLLVRVKLANYHAVGQPVVADLVDEEGTVLRSETFSSNAVKTFKIKVPAAWQGEKTLSMVVDHNKVSKQDVIVMADNIDNKQVKRVETQTPRMSITLDCAYGDKNTLELLDILDEFGAKVTFFVTGNWASAYPHHLQDIKARGHEIANHSFSHPRMTKTALDAARRQLMRCNEAIKDAVGGSGASLFRPPFGDTNEKLRAVSRSLGMEIIMWTIDSHDWDEAYTHQKIVRRVTKDVDAGHIILFHNDGKHTPAVLREVIPYYQSLGLSLVPVSQLLDEGPYTVNKEGLVQFSAQQ